RTSAMVVCLSMRCVTVSMAAPRCTVARPVPGVAPPGGGRSGDGDPGEPAVGAACGASEDHVGEVVAVADGVGAAQLFDQAAAVLGGSGGVVVQYAAPFGVGDLDRRVHCVAERDEPPVAAGDGVRGVAEGVSDRERNPHAGEDLLA